MIDFKKIEKKLIDTLNKETPESLRAWLNKKKNEEILADLGKGDYKSYEPRCGDFFHEKKEEIPSPITISNDCDYSLAA